MTTALVLVPCSVFISRPPSVDLSCGLLACAEKLAVVTSWPCPPTVTDVSQGIGRTGAGGCGRTGAGPAAVRVSKPRPRMGQNEAVPSLLLIEDDDAIRTALELSLTRQGHRVATAASGEDGLKLLREQRPDLIVLDVMLPGIDGFEVCRRIRRTDQLPIILLTARSDDIDVVVGLESGADDYVVKPVQGRVLDARIRAVLRRGEREANDSAVFGNLVIDRAAMTVTKNGEDLQLTPTELRLLLELSRRPGQALSRQQLLRLVWEHDYLGDSRLVDACVQRLRAKVEDVPSSPTLIRTVRGVGYRLDAPQ
ncbi:hypothetical protein JCM12681A_29160 [Streptomyces mexicanus]